jgi:hypothetical protein
MSEKTKKIEQDVKATELSEQDLDNVAGGVSGQDGGCIPLPKGWPHGPFIPPTGPGGAF